MNSPTTTDPSELVSVPEAARIAGVAPTTVWKWIRTGALTAYRRGDLGPMLLRRSDLEPRPVQVQAAAG
jgi:excisionase family DNA binding protein